MGILRDDIARLRLRDELEDEAELLEVETFDPGGLHLTFPGENGMDGASWISILCILCERLTVQ